ncbi:nucleotide-binding universal stress UspA family protein [Gelidibacter algens]|uniref:Nucleotide-binding universal stress UspA family protein n=1 Tax=Gelidibacter algens TaxID=49280 RepID=A0A327S028_9FLAO|nr:universal stress protein [Gelidibacter algens]RAJ22085.1 nucleotide-binding universal stress UspA family protein [Gelidibacter algens]
MKKSILIPTDFSENSKSALSYALKLYANETCTFYFLNSYAFSSSRSPSLMSSNFIGTFRDNSKRDLTKLKAKMDEENTNTNHTFGMISSSDELPHAIEASIKQHDIDLVVMGTKGAIGVDAFFFGSYTVKTIKHIKSCPVLVVLNKQDFKTPKKIAFPTDFNRPYDAKTLKTLQDFASLYDAHINVLHINVEEDLSEKQNKNISILKEYLKDTEHSFHWMPAYHKKSDVINDFIEDLDIDILAMFNYKHSIIENITKEPIIKNIGYHPTIPFLIIPSK